MEILLPIYKTSSIIFPPERIYKNFYRFFSNIDYEIINERENIISSGFFLKNITFLVTPSDIYKKYNMIASSFISDGAELAVNAVCYKKNKKDPFFAERYKVIEKKTCIFYLNILSSSNEEDYIFNIV